MEQFALFNASFSKSERTEPTYETMKRKPSSGHPEKWGDEGYCHAKCPNEDQLLVWSCRLWGAVHDQVPVLLPLPTSRKASGCCWQGRAVSIWGDSYCYRKGENDLLSHQRLLPYLSRPTAGVASPRKALSTRWYHVSQDPLTFICSAQWEASEHKLIDSSSFSETFMLIQCRLLMEFPFSEKISTSIENSTQSCSFSFQNFRSSLENSPKP